ncbi:MAG: YbaB/EbfC family nucleoid-associated protein [Bacillota bacterium]|nr:YbaB/EbfC family nucleoid-associated protein [Bacillota bacterium]
MAKGKFGGMGGMGGGNMQQLMRQAQKMQEQLAKTQEELDVKEYEASSGGGMVSCTVNGKRELVKLTIKPEAVDPDDVEMLEDLITAAVNEALRLGEETREKAMASITGGMGGLL